jgi:2Fe-2S ferredoxin
MPIIKILPHAEYCPAGVEIRASAGTSLCEALLENNIAICLLYTSDAADDYS